MVTTKTDILIARTPLRISVLRFCVLGDKHNTTPSGEFSLDTVALTVPGPKTLKLVVRGPRLGMTLPLQFSPGTAYVTEETR